MLRNHSPWIHQLNRTRPAVPLEENHSTDVVVVGGGIAGVVTAYFALRYTNNRVMLLEADKIAHGASGHNAGQITSYFERSLSDIVEEYGLEKATDAQRDVESSWGLIDEIYADAKLETPFYRFTGYAGYSTLEEVLVTLKDNRCRVLGGLVTESVLIAKESGIADMLPAEYKDLYVTVPHEDLLALLETQNPSYVALSSFPRGCMNSALFTEELAGYLLTAYRDRFSLFEHSPVRSITLEEERATLSTASEHTVETKRVILATNGFENFTIKNEHGADINTEFHHLVRGRIGYMSGYLKPLKNPPAAISYFPPKEQTGDPTGETYFYLTRRPHEHEGEKSYNLVCVGGPEKVLPNHALYSRKHASAEEMHEQIEHFLHENYVHFSEDGEPVHRFQWHGLMGYTPNGIRRAGVEPCNPVLLYNLGCNGVGILPSVFGARRISRILGGEQVPASIFDPHDQRTEGAGA